MRLNKQELKRKYITNLATQFIPFWENAIDETFGGVFTCFSNDGAELVSEDKYTWSQGRFLWLTEALLKLNDDGFIQISDKWRKSFKQTYQFLIDHTRMSNGHIVFAVQRDGKKIKEQMDTSIFADCFFVIGISAYARYYREKAAFNIAYQTFEKITERIKSNHFRSEPYPIGEDYKSHSIPMILINVSEELYMTAVTLNDQRQDILKNNMHQFLNEILQHATNERIIEMKHKNPDVANLLTTHLNPGHTLESIWFMIHAMNKINPENKEQIISHLEKIARYAIDKGWDEEFGGLFRFIYYEGGEPRGTDEGSSLESLIKDTWDMKLWWPHSEALYTTLLFYEITKDKLWLALYEKMENYVFQTFPNDNPNIGEWIQIRNRQGQPVEKVVALPVKDPFHIIRNFVLIIRLLGEDHVAWGK